MGKYIPDNVDKNLFSFTIDRDWIFRQHTQDIIAWTKSRLSATLSSILFGHSEYGP